MGHPRFHPDWHDSGSRRDAAGSNRNHCSSPQCAKVAYWHAASGSRRSDSSQECASEPDRGSAGRHGCINSSQAGCSQLGRNTARGYWSSDCSGCQGSQSGGYTARCYRNGYSSPSGCQIADGGAACGHGCADENQAGCSESVWSPALEQRDTGPGLPGTSQSGRGATRGNRRTDSRSSAGTEPCRYAALEHWRPRLAGCSHSRSGRNTAGGYWFG